MGFDAVVVEVKTFLLSDWLWPYCGTCQKVDEDFSKQMWSSRIIQTLNRIKNVD